MGPIYLQIFLNLVGDISVYLTVCVMDAGDHVLIAREPIFNKPEQIPEQN